MDVCPVCGYSITPETIICPNCGTILNETTSAISEPLLPSITQTEARLSASDKSVPNPTLRPNQVALYIEDSPTPLIIDVPERATIGRRSVRATEIMPTVALNAYDAFTKGVSRIHVTLFRRDGQLMVIDEYTINGTWLDGKRLEPMVPAVVHDQAELRLSKLRIRIVLPGKPPADKG